MQLRTAPHPSFLALEWALAAIVFEAGLLQAGLPVEILRARFAVAAGAGEPGLLLAGLAQVAAAVLLIVPARTGFLPVLTPLGAAVLAVAFGAAAVGAPVPAGLGGPIVSALLALASAAVAVERGWLTTTTPVVLGPEPRDPWRRPDGTPAVRPARGRAPDGAPGVAARRWHRPATSVVGR